MSSNSRGSETERKCIAELEADGWRIMFRSVRMRWQSVDFDNTFDVVAVKDHVWRLVQCKTGRPSTVKEMDKLDRWRIANTPDSPRMSIELWIWRKGNRWDKYVSRE